MKPSKKEVKALAIKLGWELDTKDFVIGYPVRIDELIELVSASYTAGRDAQRKADALSLSLTNSQLLLIGGEMTAQELRTVQAILWNRNVNICQGVNDEH